MVTSVKAYLMREAVENFGGFYWENDDDDVNYILPIKQKLLSDGLDPLKYGIKL